MKITDMSKTFYMVFLEGERTPACKHGSLTSAENEAMRLAKAHGKEAYVLATIKSYKLNEFNITDCRPENDDLPF